MRRGIVISAALLIFTAQAWCRQDQSQSSQGQQQPPAHQTQAQNPPPASQQDSLAEAARKAREQKKKETKGGKVFTNDNIPTEGGINTVGEEAPASESKSKAAGKDGASPSSGSNEEKVWRERFAKLHHKLSQDQAELDIMQRELGVLNVQYYADPMKAMQQSISREDIDKKTADIEAKKKDIEADNQAIADAEDELHKSGGDPGWASPQ
jgi:hypothetical protein